MFDEETIFESPDAPPAAATATAAAANTDAAISQSALDPSASAAYFAGTRGGGAPHDAHFAEAPAARLARLREEAAALRAEFASVRQRGSAGESVWAALDDDAAAFAAEVEALAAAPHDAGHRLALSAALSAALAPAGPGDAAAAVAAPPTPAAAAPPPPPSAEDFGKLEARVAALEAALGPVPPPHAGSGGGLLSLSADMARRAALLDEEGVAAARRRLGPLKAELSAAAAVAVSPPQQALSAAAGAAAALLERTARWDAVADDLPQVVDRLVQLQGLHRDAATFANRLEALEATQAETAETAAFDHELLDKLESSLRATLKAAADNAAEVDARLDAVAAAARDKLAVRLAGKPAGRGRGLATNPSVSTIFHSMEYGPAPEDDSSMDAWLDAHDRKLGMFVDGAWHHPPGREYSSSVAPATGDEIGQVLQATADDVDMAVAAAGAAQAEWAALPGHARARHLYAVARHLQKHSRVLAVTESLDNGKPIRETRDADLALAIRHFYHHAGWAQLMDSEMPGMAPLGVIAQVIPWNFPLLMLAWKIAPALAMGNTVVLKPAPSTRLSAMLFADILAEAGLPKGVVNIVSGDNDMATHLVTHPDVAKVAFTGSTGVGQFLRRVTAGTGKKLTLELGGKSAVIVYDTADLDGAVEGVVQAIWFNQGQVCCAGSRLLVQEPVYEAFLDKLKARMATLRVGHSLDKCIDMGALVDERQWHTVHGFVERGKAAGADIHQAFEPVSPEDNGGGCFYPPTLVSGVGTTSEMVRDEVFGPVLVASSFRTPDEAVALANNSRFGLGGSVWTEQIGLALETAVSVKAGSMWINCHNAFDAAAGFGGYKESGFGREGGREGLYEYVQPAWQKGSSGAYVTDAMRDNHAKWGKAVPAAPAPAGSGGAAAAAGLDAAAPAIDRTPKMYIGGAQKRPDNMHSRAVVAADGETVIGHVADGSRKDIRDAVEAAHKAAGGWGKRAAHDRAQIGFYIAENLSARRDEIAARLESMTGKDGYAEVDASIERLFHWAAYADKYGGEVQETPLYGMVAKIHEPVGVVAVVAPDESPLLGLVSLIAPLISRGNTVVVVPSEKAPLAATDLYQILDTSDLPGGVLNIVTGPRDSLARTLVEHQDVDAMWYFGSTEGSYHVERISANNLKRTFVAGASKRDWYSVQEGAGEEFLRHTSEAKNIWVPMGEQY